MLADYWVITQLLTQLFSFILLAGAGLFSIRIIRLWSADEVTELQLYLERRSYLIGFMVQFVLIFQMIALLLFLFTVNNHLPGIIKGAMCATGTLAVNDYGYSTLYLKIGSIFIYSAFLILNFLDNSEPAYPLTPMKYWLVFPALFLVTVDFYYLFEYFYHIEPDIIATCCSVSFVGSEQNAFLLTDKISATSLFHFFWYGLFAVMVLYHGISWYRLSKAPPRTVALFLSTFSWMSSFLYVFFGVITLKYFFVKYIYGLPSHNCLFDIFWARHGFVGFFIFGGYFMYIISNLFLFLHWIFQRHLQHQHVSTQRRAHQLALLGLLLSFLIPLVYWLSWEGTL